MEKRELERMNDIISLLLLKIILVCKIIEIEID